MKTRAKAPIRHIRKIPRLKIPDDLAGVLGDIAVRAATLRKNRPLDSESEAAIFLHAAAGLHVQNAINHFLSQRAYELLLAELRKKTAPSSDLVASINSLLEQLSAEDVSPFEQMRALYCYRDPDSDRLDTIEKDIALMMKPRSKFNRLVFSGPLVEAGLTLVAEAQGSASSELSRARGVRNGLMIALLALCPIRIKNFAALEIGHTFKQVHGSWWIALPSISTKSRRPDERRVPELLNHSIDVYLNQSRPFLIGSKPSTNVFWISSTTGRAMTTKNLGTLVSMITLETLGVDVSPHLFRTAAASTAAAYGGNTPTSPAPC